MWIMAKRSQMVIYLLPLFLLLANNCSADKECAARQIAGQSVVCVCNATYCDEITRDAPRRNRFVTYTSSEAGSRFKKSGGTLTDYCCKEGLVLELNTSRLYQTCEGFGGAVTDAAGINWKSLPEIMQEFIIDSYFSDCGIEYNMMRVPIGGCDFSTHYYAYNECPINDTKLKNYELAEEDYLYKIPMIKAACKVATSPIHIVSTTWSPPDWMKTDFDLSKCGFIAPEYYQTYADYHLKFLEKYGEEGIHIWGITTTNEPSNALGTLISFNCLGWTPKTMGKWIENNLGPTIRKSKYKHVKILCCDDQRPHIPFWFNVLAELHPKALEYIDGVAVHFYEDSTTSPLYLTVTSETHPNKFILGTEACEGFDGTGVLLGSWKRAKNYVTDILQDLNHNVVGWIDWNLCLDPHGGPNWAKNFVDSPIIVNAEAKEFYKQPTFYAMGHFSKFIPRGSRRIDVTCSAKSQVSNVAFKTPRNTIVVVLYNDGDAETVSIKMDSSEAIVELEANSVCTVEFCYDTKVTRKFVIEDKDDRRGKWSKQQSKKSVVLQFKWGTISVE